MKGCVHPDITQTDILGFIIYSIICNHLLEWQQHDANHTRLGFPASSRVRFWGHSILCDDQASDLTGVISGAAALAGVISGAASAAGASASVLRAASATGAEADGAVASPSQ